VACNTATAAAIHELRVRHPHLPLVGVEPALKPAVALSQTRRIGVIATRGTVGSDKFARLLGSLQGQAEFVVQACNGLALAIEQSTLPQQAEDAQRHIHALLTTYTSGMGVFGSAPGQMDTLVLGCTHYVFAQEALQALLGPLVRLVSTGEPVARQTRRRLEAVNALNPAGTPGRVSVFTTGDPARVTPGVRQLLPDAPTVQHATVLPV